MKAKAWAAANAVALLSLQSTWHRRLARPAQQRASMPSPATPCVDYRARHTGPGSVAPDHLVQGNCAVVLAGDRGARLLAGRGEVIRSGPAREQAGGTPLPVPLVGRSGRLNAPGPYLVRLHCRCEAARTGFAPPRCPAT